MDKNNKCSFVKYDIREFYLSTMENTIEKVLNLIKEYMLIQEDKIDIIKHCHKLLLYHNKDLWI